MKLSKENIKKIIQEELGKNNAYLEDLLYQVDKINDLTLLARQKIELLKNVEDNNLKNKLEIDLKQIKELSDSLQDFSSTALNESGYKDSIIGGLLVALTIGGIHMYKLNDKFNKNKSVVEKVYGNILDKMQDEDIRDIADQINDQDPTFQNKIGYDKLRPIIHDYVIKNSDKFAMNRSGTELNLIK